MSEPSELDKSIRLELLRKLGAKGDPENIPAGPTKEPSKRRLAGQPIPYEDDAPKLASVDSEPKNNDFDPTPQMMAEPRLVVGYDWAEGHPEDGRKRSYSAPLPESQARERLRYIVNEPELFLPKGAEFAGIFEQESPEYEQAAKDWEANPMRSESKWKGMV